MNICLHWFASVNKNIAFFRSCLNLYRQVFIEQKNSANEQNASLLVSFKASAAYFGAMQIGCLFIFQGHIAGYVTAKKKETDIFEYKKRRNDRLL